MSNFIGRRSPVPYSWSRAISSKSTLSQSEFIDLCSDDEEPTNDIADVEGVETNDTLFELIDLTSEDADADVEVTQDTRHASYGSSASTPRLPFGHQYLHSAMTPLGYDIRPGETVEYYPERNFLRIIHIVRDEHGEIYLKGILLLPQGDVDKKFAKGPDDYGNLREAYSILPRGRTELCAVITVSKGHHSPRVDSSLVRRSLNGIVQKRDVFFTNKPFLADEARKRHSQFPDKEELRERATLYCRWKCVQEEVSKKKAQVTQLILLDETETDIGMAVSDIEKYIKFRTKDGGKESGSTSTSANEVVMKSREKQNDTTTEQSMVIDLTAEQDLEVSKTRRTVHNAHSSAIGSTAFEKQKLHGFQPYKKVTNSFRVDKRSISQSGNSQFGKSITLPLGATNQYNRLQRTARMDGARRRETPSRYAIAIICAGGGGSALGASRAGFFVKYLVEKDPIRCDTLRHNFGPEGTCVLEIDLSEMVHCDFSVVTGGDQVDCMQFSFPCQGVSGANRNVNLELDAENNALGYALGPIFFSRRPRIVTMEQVLGINYKEDGQHLRAYIQAFTSHGYSVQWKITDCAEHANPQHRKRFSIMAACPGHILPEWAKATHGPGLSPFRTMHDAVSTITQPVHGIMAQSRKLAVRQPATNPHEPLKNCITTTGTKDTHWSGTRNFKLQELAVLQTFPQSYHFAGKFGQILEQMGNAVPPLTAKAECTAVIKALRKMDKKVAAYLGD